MTARTGVLSRSRVAALLAAIVVVVFLPALLEPALAQDQPRLPEERELQEAMQRFFENRVRAELALTDAQMEHILPRVRRSEELRAQARRERQAATRKLQRGMQQGASDDELQGWLDELEQVEERQRIQEREILAEIDTVLSVRQRVQFRVFANRFRQELQRRIRELQGGAGERPRRPFRRP